MCPDRSHAPHLRSKRHRPDYFRFAVTRSEWEIRGNFLTQAIARACPSHNYHVELLYQRRTRRARSVFQRLALPTPVSISNGICSG